MKVIILLGAPGAGKGTAADSIKSRAGFVHVSTGDMLRAAVKQGTPVGRHAESFMKRGELVPDTVIMELVDERLDAGGADARYMFDGFPRTIEQARMLDAELAKRSSKVSHVFYLDTPRDILISRLAGRRMCRGCNANYHVINIPPKRVGICDACGGELYQRPDDSESTVVNRLDVFAKQTQPLIEYYERLGILVRIDGGQHRDVTSGQIVERIQPLLAS